MVSNKRIEFKNSLVKLNQALDETLAPFFQWTWVEHICLFGIQWNPASPVGVGCSVVDTYSSSHQNLGSIPRNQVGHVFRTVPRVI